MILMKKDPRPIILNELMRSLKNLKLNKIKGWIGVLDTVDLALEELGYREIINRNKNVFPILSPF